MDYVAVSSMLWLGSQVTQAEGYISTDFGLWISYSVQELWEKDL